MVTEKIFSAAKLTQVLTHMHPDLSGSITTLTVHNTWRLQTFVQQRTP